MKVSGKCSWFGGPDDDGVSPSEDLAFIYSVDDQPELFLPEQPPGTTGLARRLDPSEYYVACRWPYTDETKDEWREALLERKALVTADRTGKAAYAFPADWGPAEWTGRVADISPQLLSDLGIETDDTVTVEFPYEEMERPTLQGVVISSGHGLHIRGASGPAPWGLDEVDEARKVVPIVAKLLRKKGFHVWEYHDDVSTTQSENLERIVDFHNSKDRELDVSVHFNANEPTDAPMGTECLYVSQDILASQIAIAISNAGKLKNRGPKFRDDLYFLNHTEAPAILIEVCFVDSEADVEAYHLHFDAICQAIADVIAGEEIEFVA